jgi:hypothetical protein
MHPSASPQPYSTRNANHEKVYAMCSRSMRRGTLKSPSLNAMDACRHARTARAATTAIAAVNSLIDLCTMHYDDNM